ncbi:Adenine deaminase [Seminavis robusta]|uniref:adenine deaminase n=1 Tax=Seminavis robusta TaxID=568900 RepID=A0A9N8E3W4_9STRA|nr:Adenine deaminase [Seminavis robusta]|eukprot:Sro593_g172240.1 Adenine deaminase (608) ;mRNA; r:10902-12832
MLRQTVPSLRRCLGMLSSNSGRQSRLVVQSMGVRSLSTSSSRTPPISTSSDAIIQGQVVDIHNRRIFPGQVHVKGTTIASIQELSEDDTTIPTDQYILPGFCDSHVHVESSLLVPSEFARLSVSHGTVAIVTDPHEIANVCGMPGIRFMLDNAAQVPFHFFFGAPSCVPATAFETAGAEITADDIRELFDHPDYKGKIVYLAEMMNWPGVIAEDPDCLEKIQIALDRGLPVDGHAPNVRSPLIEQYAKHGMTTDHESFTLPEAKEKIAAGLKVQIREGSGARNFDELHPILGLYPEQTMFCCDDTHPDLLRERHLDWHVREAVKLGYNLFDVLRAASKNVVEHYKLPVGLLRQGDNADFIVVNNLQDFDVQETWINGQCVARHKEPLFDSVPVSEPINFFDRTDPITIDDIARNDPGPVRVIVAHDGQLVTSEQHLQPGGDDPDVLKIVNVNRYDRNAPIATAYIKGFGLQQGAFAGSVAHDSHNIVAVGCTDQDLVDAVNAIINVKGGLSFSKDGQAQVLPLPVAGLMSTGNGPDVADEYILLDRLVKENGSKLRAPYMTLSFMALLVIPQLKLSDKGLFCGKTFRFMNVSLAEDEEQLEGEAASS